MKTMKARLETARLVLRAFTLDDAHAAYEMDRDPEVSRYTHERGVQSKEEMRQRLLHNVIGDYEKHGFGRFAVEEKTSGDFIGFAGLKYLPEMDEVDIGYRFVRRCWGRGLATEAGEAVMEFGWRNLGLKRIIGLALAENRASIRVLEKLGLRFEKMIQEDGVEAMCFAVERVLKPHV
jgi:RimJ/RimL family protein N-acetyltransferase